MMAPTHAIFSINVVALTLCTYDIRMLLICAIASQLPDVDTPNSHIGRILFPISAIVSRLGHRQITHSILGTAIAWVCFLPLLWVGSMWYWSAAIGYFSGWLLDAASKTGVPIFYPSLKRAVFPLDPTFRLKTGSITERLFQLLLALMLALTLVMNVGGGALVGFSNWLGSSAGAIDTYHRYANDREVYAIITGFHRATQQPVNQERMQIIGSASESDLIVQDNQRHRYRAGTAMQANIRTTRVQVELGRLIKVSNQTIQVPEIVPLSSLIEAIGKNSYVTGELHTDEGTLLSSQSDPRYDTAIKVEHINDKEARLTLESATVPDLQSLPDIWIQGSVVIRRIS
ncbi:MAG: metal-dependent hydrolase [Leptolyngbyaceae cyanobacterium RU_5_1]|nr:metal-dependent hydrolase [Leptolyngbyaceae cyanobacterium RU_5_1]